MLRINDERNRSFSELIGVDVPGKMSIYVCRDSGHSAHANAHCCLSCVKIQHTAVIDTKSHSPGIHR